MAKRPPHPRGSPAAGLGSGCRGVMGQRAGEGPAPTWDHRPSVLSPSPASLGMAIGLVASPDCGQARASPR